MFGRASLSWVAVVDRQDEHLIQAVVVALAFLAHPSEVAVGRSCRGEVDHVQEVRVDDHRDVVHADPSYLVAVGRPSLACHSDHNRVRPSSGSSSFPEVVRDHVVAAHEVHLASDRQAHPLVRPCLVAFRVAANLVDLQDLRSSLAVDCRRMDLKQRACPRSRHEAEERTFVDQVRPFHWGRHSGACDPVERR